MGNEAVKAEFLAVAKWACKYANVKLLFDSTTGPHVDIRTRVIHMPSRMAIKDMPIWIGTVIHEAMHVKHTPIWLSQIPRDDADHTIINAIEDERIEGLACRQLRAFSATLNRMVQSISLEITDDEHTNGNMGMQVLGNFACQHSKRKPFYKCYSLECRTLPLLKKLKARHDHIITKVTPTAFKQHLTEYYAILDELKALLNLPAEDKQPQQQQKKQQGAPGPSDGKPKEQEGEGDSEEGEALPVGKTSQKEPQKGKGILQTMAYRTKPSGGESQGIDMDGMAVTEHSVPLNDSVRERIKTALKKTTQATADDGNCLDTDEIISFMTGDIDDLFYEETTEKKMRTKVYFLMDTSGSMHANDMDTFMGSNVAKHDYGCPTRLDVAHGAFVSLRQVIDELKEEDGCDIDYEAFVFADHCAKWPKMDKENMPPVGGGTAFYKAMEHVVGEIMKEDPSNKRILVVITDGDMSAGQTDSTETLLLSTGQDIRVVFVQIGDDNRRNDFFKHKITGQETANIAVYEAFEEAL
jgi:hypothetical protein